MGKKQLIQEIAHDLEEEGPRKTLANLHAEYGLDQRELGKIMLITSLAMFIVAAPSALTLQESHDQIQKVNNDMDEVQGMINSQSFQQSLDALQSRVGGTLGRTLGTISSDLEKANSSMSKLEKTEETLDQRAHTYKWISLISLLGIISGAVTMYI
jgi:hypothetical protein